MYIVQWYYNIINNTTYIIYTLLGIQIIVTEKIRIYLDYTMNFRVDIAQSLWQKTKFLDKHLSIFMTTHYIKIYSCREILLCHPSSTRSLMRYTHIKMRYRGYRRSAAMRTDLRFFSFNALASFFIFFGR